MKWIRFILFPFGLLYAMITEIRNWLFDKGLLKSYVAPVPVIAVGNLSVGGTGKSPQTEYLIRLLSEKYRVAVLSRGYKRKSKGFVLANENTNMEEIGDEPFQFHTKFKYIHVAVDAHRTNGMKQLLQTVNPEVILLDDAYQHRKVKATAYILLTAYGDLYCDDYILPVGNLRESARGAKRAQIVIVTKCPENISLEEKQMISKKLKLKSHQQLFFTTIGYDEFVYNADQKIAVKDLSPTDIFALAGIANPALFYAHLNASEQMTFPDHHHFSSKDLDKIMDKSHGKLIVTTEKDYMRLSDKLPQNRLYYLPIQIRFLENKSSFDQTIFSIFKSGVNS